MQRYYRDRVPFHDKYMSWNGAEGMEALLAPIIDIIGKDLMDRDVLEVACGTGNWTQVLSARTRSVTATDLIDGYLETARSKPYPRENVEFRSADAYSLEDIGGPFDGAFAADWWSHMPLSMVDTFLRSLGNVLVPGARVVIVDMTRTASFELAFHGYDDEGNELQLRTLPSGGSYRVIKNFPDEGELRGRLDGWAEDISYLEDNDLGRWLLRFALSPRD
jgi:demethylmenaquinone methyltransferase/2-methoxy-6-polyprenyl-1,4-benzoquinol methylase